MGSLCWECKYEHSDCKGDKWIEKAKCDYFSKKLAINYPKVIEELERKVELFESLYQGQLDTNEALLLRADRLEAERNELKKRMEKMKYDFDFINSDRNLLKADNEKFKEHIKSLDDIILQLKDERGDCFEDCSTCEVKCRAWQNGFNAKGGNMSFDSVQMLHRIVEEVTPEWYGNNCISCAWFNNLKGVGGYCAYHNNKTTAKGGCNKWAKECDTE